MRRIITALLCLGLGLGGATSVSAQEQGVAAGIMLGSPTGISILLRDRVALGAAWSFRDYIHVHGDLWVYHGPLVEPIDWYVGIGAKFRAFSDSRRKDDFPVGIGARVPLGLRFFPLEQLELFLELAPGISLVPDTSPDLDAVLGVRFHF
ncbi:MAG: hypothetical protein EA428_10900 [Spirochaetaceae bacterium]|nr:MAG: hypothetical protein EA428_10900 [Spirochaetaceae bacterium]